MALQKLSLIRGDSQTYTICLKQSSGVAYDITNWTVYFTLKENVDLPDSSASLQKIVTSHTDAAAGTTQISILPGDTDSLTPGEYDFDIQVQTVSDEIFTVMRGKLTIEYDVTRTGTAGTAGT